MPTQKGYNSPEQKAFDADFSMEKFVSGDSATLSGLYENYFEPLCSDAAGFARLDGRAPEDIVQESFVKLWEHRENFANISFIKSYLRKVTKNNCIDRYRMESGRDKYRPGLIRHFAKARANIVTPQRWTEGRDDLKVVLKEMDKDTILPQQRDALIMHVELDLKYKEIAQKMKTPLNTVPTNIHLARKKLQSVNPERNALKHA